MEAIGSMYVLGGPVNIPTATHLPFSIYFAKKQECLRTVEFGFHWMYIGELPEIGQPDPKLVSIRRRVENSRHEYPEEQVALVGEYMYV